VDSGDDIAVGGFVVAEKADEILIMSLSQSIGLVHFVFAQVIDVGGEGGSDGEKGDAEKKDPKAVVSSREHQAMSAGTE
jgi:hypothetical protein